MIDIHRMDFKEKLAKNVRASIAAIPEPAKRLAAARHGMDRWNAELG
jgi:hypothetical protein